jgi:hypothetical protein
MVIPIPPPPPTVRRPLGMRRFTHLPQAFSKKLEDHGHAIALYFVYHDDFTKVDQTVPPDAGHESGHQGPRLERGENYSLNFLADRRPPTWRLAAWTGGSIFFGIPPA